MYLRDLTLKNVKLLRDLKLPFIRNGKPRMWTVLLGENGLCKTTVLQAIAMAAVGWERANQLAEAGIDALRDRRQSNAEVEITADFTFGNLRHSQRKYPGWSTPPANPPLLTSIVNLKPDHNLLSGRSRYAGNSKLHRDPLQEAQSTGLAHWFVAAYGVRRTLPLPQLTQQLSNPHRKRLESLFDKNESLIGTGFADLFENTKRSQEFAASLRHALLDDGALLPRIKGFDLRGRGGITKAAHIVESHRFSFTAGNRPVKIPATWLSQGYQALIAWVADLLGYAFWDANQAVLPSELEGLVLIDELDLHLHPMWQVQLIPALKRTFPNVQFVVTTHSPMLLPGLEADELWILKQDKQGNVQALPNDHSPALMTGSEIYQNFFGIDELFPNELGEALDRYGYLAGAKELNATEQNELSQLKQKLDRAGVNVDW